MTMSGMELGRCHDQLLPSQHPNGKLLSIHIPQHVLHHAATPLAISLIGKWLLWHGSATLWAHLAYTVVPQWYNLSHLGYTMVPHGYTFSYLGYTGATPVHLVLSGLHWCHTGVPRPIWATLMPHWCISSHLGYINATLVYLIPSGLHWCHTGIFCPIWATWSKLDIWSWNTSGHEA